MISSGAWLRREWAIDPSPCEECGKPRGVGCYLKRGTTPNKEHWAMFCTDCTRLDLIEGGGSPTYLAIGVEPGSAKPHAKKRSLAESRIDPYTIKVRVYQDPGAWLTPAVYKGPLNSLENLETARRIWSKNPGQMRVVVHDDGTLWLPWDPTSYRRSGDKLRLIERTLRSSKYRRTCEFCQLEMGAGPAWRPQAGAWGQSWGSKAMTQTLVCSSCVRKAREAHRPRPVLRVILGGA